MKFQKDEVMQVVKKIKYPGFSRDIVSFGLVKDISFDDNVLKIMMTFSTEDPEKRTAIMADIRKELAGYHFKDIIFDLSERKAAEQQAGSTIVKQEIPGVKFIIATASGKGGVGKSTVAVNLASALASLNYKTGLLDADIYGPSIPLMLNINEAPKAIENKLIPVEKYGLKIISIGFFLKSQDDALIWRGPMVMRAVEQLLFDVQWGELDFLVVDLPPGTGDAQLTLAQRVPISGAIIVTTPQDVALIDARKAVNMFKSIGTPILGIIENMSYFICPHCTTRTDIFSHGGGKKTSLQMQVPYLGELPIIPSLREKADEGIPSSQLKESTRPEKIFFEELAKKIAGIFIKK